MFEPSLTPVKPPFFNTESFTALLNSRPEVFPPLNAPPVQPAPTPPIEGVLKARKKHAEVERNRRAKMKAKQQAIALKVEEQEKEILELKDRVKQLTEENSALQQTIDELQSQLFGTGVCPILFDAHNLAASPYSQPLWAEEQSHPSHLSPTFEGSQSPFFSAC